MNYESDSFPKYCDVSGESDCVEHCAGHSTCINAIKLSGGDKITPVMVTASGEVEIGYKGIGCNYN